MKKELEVIILLIMSVLSIMLSACVWYNIGYFNAVKIERKQINQQWVQELNKRKLINVNKDGGFTWKNK